MPRSSSNSLETLENSHHGATYPVGRLPDSFRDEVDALVQHRGFPVSRVISIGFSWL